MLRRLISKDGGRSGIAVSPLSLILDLLALPILDLDLHAILREGYVALLHLPLPVRGKIAAIDIHLVAVSHTIKSTSCARSSERLGDILGIQTMIVPR
jgi:hypothetical protein